MSAGRSGLVDVITVGVGKIDRSRLIRVLQLAAERAEWNQALRPRDDRDCQSLSAAPE